MPQEIEIIGLREVMELTGLGKKAAIKLLKNKNCPLLPRKRGQKYLINKASFIRFLEGEWGK